MKDGVLIDPIRQFHERCVLLFQYISEHALNVLSLLAGEFGQRQGVLALASDRRLHRLLRGAIHAAVQGLLPLVFEGFGQQA